MKNNYLENSEIQVQQRKENVDLKKTLSLILSNWYLFVLGLIIALSFAWLLNRYTVPVYLVKSNLMVKETQDNSPFTSGGAISEQAFEGFGLPGALESNLYNQLAILYTRPIVEKTMQELEFEVSYFVKGEFMEREVYNTTPFTVYWEKDHLQLVNLKFFVRFHNDSTMQLEAMGESIRVHDYQLGVNIKTLPTVQINKLAKLGERIADENYAFRILVNERSIPQEGINYVFRFNTKQQLINYYRKRLSASVEDNRTTILALSLRDFNIQKGIDYLNKLMQTYQEDNLNRKNEYANRTIAFINSQLSQISDSLTASERELLAFQSDQKVVDLTVQAEQILEQLNILDNELARMEAQDRYYRYLRNYIMENQDLESIMAPSSLGVDDPVLTSLIMEINTLTIEKSTLGNVRESPRLTQLNAQIEKIKNAMLENINDIISQGEINLNDLKRRIWQAEALARKLPVTERNLINIERKYQLNNETYTFLLQRLSEAQIAKASNEPDSQVIEEAGFKGQISPNTMMNYTLALSLGLVIPLLFIFLRDFFNTRIDSKEDIENLTKIPILGHVFLHKDKKDRNTPVLDKPASRDSEPFGALRNKINFMTRGNDKPVIAVTSTAPKEGKSYTAINLASSYSLLNKKTILLDLDLRNSNIRRILDIESEMGVANYILGEAGINEITFNVRNPNFHVIPAGPIPPNPGEILMDDKVVTLMKELKVRYEVIVIDNAPVGYLNDLFRITDMLDTTVFVLRDQITKSEWFKNALVELHALKLKSLGIVINGIKRNKNKYRSYGYGYGYGYGMKEGKNKRKHKK